VYSIAAASTLVRSARDRGKRVVFTNGVFDLLHPGHVRYLAAARELGDVLVVGLNSDRSVRANKGPGRPITPEAERAEILAALACVDAVAIFDEETPAGIIRAIQPDVLVKGADWAEDAIVGRDTVEARGGRVVRVPVEPGWSTSAIVERIRGVRDRGSGVPRFRGSGSRFRSGSGSGSRFRMAGLQNPDSSRFGPVPRFSHDETTRCLRRPAGDRSGSTPLRAA
jgi:D-beta-D-heptose 7-phosphate kinase/D-beta-D-heptose 1-phosphate adenosyltransferase